MEYYKLNKLLDWNNSEVLLIDINEQGQAIVRVFGLMVMIEDYKSVPEAIEQAHNMIKRDPWHKSIAIYLQENAKWDNSWGKLSSQTSIPNTAHMQ